MTNLKDVTDLGRERTLPWRAIGVVAADLLARAEARLEEGRRQDEAAFVPVAWAAE